MNENKPLPTLTEPQPTTLSNHEYQSIAASAVLLNSLEKSRSRWVCNGVLERYWVKPEKGTGKNAKPPPPHNPDPRQMKMRGECRIRIEPHLFVANLYVVEKYVLPPKNKPPMAHQSRPVQPTQQFQNRNLPPGTQQYQQRLPASQAPSCSPSTPQTWPSRAQPPPVPALSPGQKVSPDPVISMLATRASSDPELKTLMKEVATGSANPDQLKIFQKHIDELTAIIAQQKKNEEEAMFTPQQQSSAAPYDGPSEMRAQPVQPLPQKNTLQQRMPSFAVQAQPAPAYGPQQPWTAPVAAPPATNLPVVLEFTGAGATEDRFLFPEYSILEVLSPQHLLVSYILTRHAREAVDTTGLDLDQEYWQPITMMIEVAYGREELLNCIRRWVRPREEVRTHMHETMKRCRRAPNSYLALRLPIKGAAATDREDVSQELTPSVEEKKAKPRPAAKKKAAAAPAPKTVEAGKTQKNAVPVANDANLAVTPSADSAMDGVHARAETPAECGRPRRAIRKSVRISEG